jgi:hypothetical protein
MRWDIILIGMPRGSYGQMYVAEGHRGATLPYEGGVGKDFERIAAAAPAGKLERNLVEACGGSQFVSDP